MEAEGAMGVMMVGATTDPSVASRRFTSAVDEFQTFVRQYSDYAYPILRVGLGLVILFAGAHKLVAPDVWVEYAAPWVTALWPETLLSLEVAMIINGVFELLFGIAALVGFYTTITAGIIALSLVTVVLDLLALAIGVTILSAQEERGE